ncbi:hypothetical protein [Ornithinimicrobium sediminis]|uniref:hypothetical protein n=1 Tax=Ornithinimicrobium sediminis TaxID=2904603 RepID=UPI001E4D0D9D|nr:hypothetical protein [Ornithinimicrobium sediminis]MCE0488216.1 hypothetical protein [Ornithinimicrobium sediminis]
MRVTCRPHPVPDTPGRQPDRSRAERQGDDELVELFTKAQADSKKGAERGSQLLATP